MIKVQRCNINVFMHLTNVSLKIYSFLLMQRRTICVRQTTLVRDSTPITPINIDNESVELFTFIILAIGKRDLTFNKNLI